MDTRGILRGNHYGVYERYTDEVYRLEVIGGIYRPTVIYAFGSVIKTRTKTKLITLLMQCWRRAQSFWECRFLSLHISFGRVKCAYGSCHRRTSYYEWNPLALNAQDATLSRFPSCTFSVGSCGPPLPSQDASIPRSNQLVNKRYPRMASPTVRC